nr:MAG TPA_asm: hypothetical protein [Caudoviricetes sp.]
MSQPTKARGHGATNHHGRPVIVYRLPHRKARRK